MSVARVVNEHMEKMLNGLYMRTGKRHTLEVKLSEDLYFEYWTAAAEACGCSKDLFPGPSIQMNYSSGKVFFSARPE